MAGMWRDARLLAYRSRLRLRQPEREGWYTSLCYILNISLFESSNSAREGKRNTSRDVMMLFFRHLSEVNEILYSIRDMTSSSSSDQIIIDGTTSQLS